MARRARYRHRQRAPLRQADTSQIELQRRAGGNVLIGRQLHPLTVQAGLRSMRVSVRQVDADASRPQWVEDFTHKTFVAMIPAVRTPALPPR